MTRHTESEINFLRYETSKKNTLKMFFFLFHFEYIYSKICCFDKATEFSWVKSSRKLQNTKCNILIEKKIVQEWRNVYIRQIKRIIKEVIMSSPPCHPNAQQRRESFARRQESLMERVSQENRHKFFNEESNWLLFYRHFNWR